MYNEGDSISIAEARREFEHRGGYLNSASIGLPPKGATQAFRAAVDRWAVGGWTAPQFDTFVTEARQRYAALTQVPASWVSVGANVSTSVALVATSLPLGSEVVYAKDDFTSLLFPFLERARAGELTVREVPVADIANAVRPQTALVAVSAVQSATGHITDLDALAQAAHAHGAATLIDATQAVGWLPLDARPFDYVVTAGYKWLLNPRGVAFMSVRPEKMETLRPRNAGWYAGEDVWSSAYGAPLRLASNARRFDLSPAWFSWVAGASSLAFIQRVGVSNIHAHNVSLANAFCDRLERPQAKSAIVSLPTPGAAATLRQAGIVISERNGNTRLSFHMYNTLEDVERAAKTLRA